VLLDEYCALGLEMDKSNDQDREGVRWKITSASRAETSAAKLNSDMAIKTLISGVAIQSSEWAGFRVSSHRP
jgi:hypothetical protein